MNPTYQLDDAYYYLIEGTPSEPISLYDLLCLIANKQLAHDTPICKLSDNEWKTISDLGIVIQNNVNKRKSLPKNTAASVCVVIAFIFLIIGIVIALTKADSPLIYFATCVPWFIFYAIFNQLYEIRVNLRTLTDRQSFPQ